jgi:hypothetical protein
MPCDSNTVFGDGAFYSCSELFYQLYTLDGYIEDTSYPLVFALLPNKTEQTYTRLFTMLKGALLKNNLFLTPQLVLMDFETAARNALKAVFPQMTLKACCFHFALCIWRKTQACGLAGLEWYIEC